MKTNAKSISVICLELHMKFKAAAAKLFPALQRHKIEKFSTVWTRQGKTAGIGPAAADPIPAVPGSYAINWKAILRTFAG